MGLRSAEAADLLGGKRVLGRRMADAIDAHDMLFAGMPSAALEHLLASLKVLPKERLLDGALGMSLRTFQRHREAPDRHLSREQSSRTWKFAEILAKAIEIFGSREAAETWLAEPAVGLDRRRPIDLLATTAGTDAVETLLTQLDYGVYA